jgi:manganese transport protein
LSPDSSEANADTCLGRFSGSRSRASWFIFSPCLLKQVSRLTLGVKVGSGSMKNMTDHRKGGVIRLLTVIGPGIVVAGSVMGSGELINTPVQAAKFGFVLLWVALLSCIIKYFLQVEIGRHAMVHGRTTHQALNRCPGPHYRGTSWIGIVYMGGYMVSLLTAPGMLGAMAGMMQREIPLDSWINRIAGDPGNNVTDKSIAWWGAILVVLTIALLWKGAYRHLEVLIAILVGVFSVSVAIALVMIQASEYRITLNEILSGLSFSFGDTPKLAAYAVISLMGALGATANELFMYPYWILEKGYNQQLGDPADARWAKRAQEWVKAIRIDSGVATALATVMTAAFFLLGCTILHREGVVPEGSDVVETISQVYTKSFGGWSRTIFLIGAFATLFSTILVTAAAAGRMFGDFFGSLKLINYEDLKIRNRVHRWTQTIIMLIVLGVFLWCGSEPVRLIVFGQFFSAVFSTPLLLFAICWMAFHTDPRVRMSRLTAFFLVTTSLIIAFCVVAGLIIGYLT